MNKQQNREQAQEGKQVVVGWGGVGEGVGSEMDGKIKYGGFF